MANVEALIQQAIAAIKANRRSEARQILEQVVELDERSEEGWLWLSGCVDSPDEQKICLDNVLTINPNNAKARKGLEMLKKAKTRPAAPPPSAGPFSSAPFADSGLDDRAGADASPPGANRSSPAFGDDTYGNVFTPPTPRSNSSVDWGSNSGVPAHGSGRNVPQPSDAEYDDWLENLPIGSTPADGGDMNDDFSGPFSVSPANTDAYDTDYNAPSEEPVTGGPFGAPDQYENPYSFNNYDNQAAQEPSYLENTYGYEAAPQDTDEPPPQKPPKTRAAVPEDDLAAQPATPAYAAEPSPSRPNVFGGGAKTSDVFAGEGAPPVLGSSSAAPPSAPLFKAIPAEIQIGGGRAPAADKGLLIGVAVLAIGNLISIILLLINLTGG